MKLFLSWPMWRMHSCVPRRHSRRRMGLLLSFAGSLSLAAGAVDTPSVGYARAIDGMLVRVSGIAASFVTTATEHTATMSFGFSGQLGFVKLPFTIRVLNSTGEKVSESDAPAGVALFGFNGRGDAGVVYYPATDSMVVFAADEWHSVPFQTDGSLLALGLKDSAHVSAIIGRDELSLLSIRVSDGAIEDETILGPGRGPILLPQTGGVLFRRDAAFIYRDADGVERKLDIPSDTSSLLHMGAGWVQLQTESGRNLALRLDPDIRVYEIPEVSQ